MRNFTLNANYKRSAYGKEQLALCDQVSLDKAYSTIIQLPDYNVTPVIEMPKTAQFFGIKNLYCKFEGERFGGGSFKPLGVSYALLSIVKRILDQDTLLDVSFSDLISKKFKKELAYKTFTAATSGNHGFALAWTARLLGVKCKVYCPDNTSIQRVTRMKTLGAEVILVAGGFDNAVHLCIEESQEFGYIVVSGFRQKDFDDIPALIMNGYGILAKEMQEQIPEKHISHIFVGGGGGRLAASVAALSALQRKSPYSKIIVVEPETSDCIFKSLASGRLSQSTEVSNSFMTGLVVKEPSPIAWSILSIEAFAALRLSDEFVLKVLKDVNVGLHGDVPIPIGETGIAAMAGFIFAVTNVSVQEALQLNEQSVVAVIACEGIIDRDLFTSLIGSANLTEHIS